MGLASVPQRKKWTNQPFFRKQFARQFDALSAAPNRWLQLEETIRIDIDANAGVSGHLYLLQPAAQNRLHGHIT